MGKQGYQPLAGTGHNTIRKFDGKYQGMHPGDRVVMNHTPDLTTHGPAFATELLIVSSIAIGALYDLIVGHGAQNHQAMLGMSFKELEKHILSCYPLAEGQERNPQDPFIALYF